MKKFALLLVGILLSATIFAQNTEQRTITSFDKIKVSGEIKVFISKGDKETATIKSYEIPTSDIIAEVNGKTLEIKLKKGIYKQVKAEVYVTFRELRDISVAAAAYVSANDTLKADKLTLSVITSSEFDCDIIANTMDVKVGQGSSARIRGNVKNYEASVNTAGILSALELKSDSTFVTVGSGATAKVFASELLDAKVRMGGSLTYTGTPKQKNIKTFLGSTVLEQ
ncbi:MAG: head GIN domain-containing protein [Bacteroidales bacterium]